jgi:4-diphosphocytidyl-2-C-methyl-D-erythritol kinase
VGGFNLNVGKETLKKMESLAKVFSPAKINLSFAVTGLRRDGYHDVLSANFALNFGDDLTIDWANGKCDEVFCDADFLDKKRNTITLALDIFRQATGLQRHFTVTLNKKIPPQSGFGGGSSNGATVLMAANRLNNYILPEAELLRLSGNIGADCPFFCAQRPSLVSGIGEIYEPIDGATREALKNYHLWIFKPPFGVDTGHAYADLRTKFQRLYVKKNEAMDRFLRLRRAILAEETSLPLFNTFAQMFFQRHHHWFRLCRDLQEMGANAMLSGSGSGFFCLMHKSLDRGPVEAKIRETLGHNGLFENTSLAV